MVKRFIIIVIALFAVLLVGCRITTGDLGISGIKGSGKFATRDYSLNGFRSIDACCGFRVTVTGGDSFKVSVTTDDNVLDYILAQKEGDTLRLGFDTSKATSFSTQKLEAVVTMPELQSVTLSGGAQLFLGQPAPKGANLNVNGSGGSRAELAGMSVQSARVTLSGGASANVNVSGKLDYNLSGGAQLRYTGNPSVGSSATSGGAAATRY